MKPGKLMIAKAVVQVCNWTGKSFTDAVVDICYEAAGHTDLPLVSDQDFFEAAQRIVADDRRYA